MIPNVVFTVLRALIQIGGEGNTYQLEAASGYSRDLYRLVSTQMQADGLIGRHFSKNGHTARGRGNPLIWITEKGKILYAIEYGKRSRATRKGTAFHRPTIDWYVKRAKVAA